MRRDWESLARDHPNDPAIMTGLGVLYAYLGRKEEALRESRRAVDLVPENDAIERPAYSTNLALVYALTGESEKAVTLIEQLLTKPAAGSARGAGNDPDEPAELEMGCTAKQSAFPENSRRA